MLILLMEDPFLAQWEWPSTPLKPLARESTIKQNQSTNNVGAVKIEIFETGKVKRTHRRAY